MATIDKAMPGASIASRPRLMVLKMILENFKSYGGAKEIGPFHKSFSSVVGPNGSGKSNVIDAMLFVFGKRASKMRMNKVSELIHKSAEYPDLDYASVAVYFQEIIDDGSEDGYTVVPGSQFVVSRVAYKNNSSKYFVNGTTSSFSDVTTMLKDRGVDLDNNRFLILQGEVEQISMMKPKASVAGEEGLLEYLEDIIGCNVYLPRIAEAEKVMEALSTERTEKLHRVKAAEKEVTALESSKQEAEALLQKERDIQRQQAVLCQKTIYDTQTMYTTAETKRNDANEHLQQAKKSKAEYEASMSQLTQELDAATKKHEDAARKFAAATDKRAAAERDDIRLKENLQHAVRTVKKAEESIQKEAVQYAQACATLESLKAAMPELEAAVTQCAEALKTEQAGYEGVLAALAGETEGLRGEMEKKQASLAPAADAARESQARLDTIRMEAKLLKERMEAGSKEVAALTTQKSELAASATAKQAELDAARAEVAALQARKVALVKELDAVQRQEAKAAEDVRELRAKVEDAAAAMASATGSSTLETQLKLACKKGGPLAHVGFYGRLGDLGAIDATYDVAISTACGALNWLVVDSADSGQACVEYMRAKALGRAKFVCLDKIAWVMDKMSGKFAAPAGTQRLFDLVKVKDERFRSAFYFALRDTLVADSIDHAVKVAYTGPGGSVAHRVVTLAGELIDTSGTMSGGGKVAKKGGMGSAVATSDMSPEELAAAQKELSTLTALHTSLKEKRTALVAEQKEMEKSLPKLTTKISKLEMEIAAAAKLMEDLSARIAKMSGETSASAEDKTRFAQLEKEIATLAAEHKKLAAAADALEQQVNALQREILEVGGEKLRRGKARCDRAKESLEQAEKAVTKAAADMKAAENVAEKAKKVVEKAKAEILEGKNAIQKLKAESDALVEVAIAAEKEKEEANQERLEADKQLNTVKQQYSGAEKQLRSLRDAEREYTAAADEAEAIWATLKKKLSQWQAKLASLASDYTHKIAEALADREADMVAGGEIMPALISSATAASEAEEAAAPSHSKDRAEMLRFSEPLELPQLSESTLKGMTLDDIQHGIAMAEAERDSIAKKVNMQSISEYRVKNREYLRRVAELDTITQARDAARKQWEGLRKQRLDEFMAGFSVISLKLKEMYQMITLGGDAELELVDTCDPFAEGILFQVRPPKKSWKNICNLSGGEKTLSSLALVFALHHYKPTPLYVMDEIDAALDFKNVSIVANYIKERTKDAQFVVISLRNNMFELADRLVGIYKTMDVTKSITINPKKMAEECGLTVASKTAAVTDETTAASTAPKKVLGERSNLTK